MDVAGGEPKAPPLDALDKIAGNSPFLMGKLTISTAMFNSYVSLLEGSPLIDRFQ